MITIYGEHDARTIDQLKRCVAAEDGAIGALMPDGHLGYSMPIGGVVAYREHISPSGVGFDIGCGNKAVLTNLKYEDIEDDMPAIMDEIVTQISFGMGRNNPEPVDHPVLDTIVRSPSAFQRKHVQLAANQLGTVGAGNHYVDLFRDEQDRVWIGVHFGSRGFGHKTATYYLEQAGGKSNDMDAPPTLLRADGDSLGDEYIQAMEIAGEYAYAGRDVVCHAVLHILGTAEVDSVHNHHNYAWSEQHNGEWFWVVRKGATPAFPGQRGFVGGSMGECSVILTGTGVSGIPSIIFDEESEGVPASALMSTVHGAGRAMSRTEAAGKVKRRKRAACMNRDCDYVRAEGGDATAECPECGSHLKRIWVNERVKEGKIDFDAVRASMRDQGIELRGGAADEAPLAYKRLHEVLAAAPGIEINHILTPIGVAMAGADTYDPYKD